MFKRLNTLYESDKLPWVIICYGIVLRVVQYLYNRSLYIDEARDTVVGILGRSFSDLFKPPPSIFPPSHPAGFFMIEKISVWLLGDSEFALRLFPLLAGVISLFIFYFVSKQYIKQKAIPLALILFATLEPLIYYSSSVRPYSSDVTIALLILYLAVIYTHSEKLDVLRILILGFLGAISVWFSNPSVFMLTGAGLSLVFVSITRKEWKRIGNLAVVYSIWGINIIIYYLLFLHNLTNNEYLYYAFKGEDAFMPFPISFSTPKWFIARFFGIFEETAGFFLPGIAALPFLIGCISIFLEKKEKFFILISPIFLVFLASCLSLYPFRQRLLLFTVPALLLFIAEGTEKIRESTMGNKSSLIGFVFIGLLLFHPLLSSSYHIFKPISREEIKPVLSYIRHNWQKGDVLYVHYRAHPAFTYYSKRYGFSDNDYIVGIYAGDRNNIWAFSVDYLKAYANDLNKLRGNKRVWILFSDTPILHKGIDEEVFFLYYLNTIGKQIDSFKGIEASVYLYDLSKEPSDLVDSHKNGDVKRFLHWNF